VSRIELVVPVDIDAPAATVWDVVTDWVHRASGSSAPG
jgi:hypothetical protein